jgi:SAM-dependent methyltransferase
MLKRANVTKQVANYYSSKLAAYSDTPQGVDWNGYESQIIRFKQLCKLFETQELSFSLNDLGCGYGALLEYLNQQHSSYTYTGIDISYEMISVAKQRSVEVSNARFVVSDEPDQLSDYGVASGIFNVKLSHSDEEWYLYMLETLDSLNRTSQIGFAFNCLSSYSDEDKRREDLYYADPIHLFDLCKRRYSKNIALLHDYGLYEFTILVRKN